MIQQHTQPTEAVRSPMLASLARLDPRAALRRAYATNRALTLLGVLMLATLVVCLIGLLADPRIITGAPAWLKPTKFAISIALYSFTLLWILSFVEGRRFWVRMVSFVSLPAIMIEMIVIITQVLRGTTSHFNVGTAFDATLFSTMGLLIIVVWAMNLVAAILLLVQRLPDPAIAWSLRLALLLTLVGAALGVLMTRPTSAQLDGMRAHQPVSIVGAHSVGVADGGPGLPVTGWSTTGGDLRIGHFLGLHALQLLPLIGWLLARRRMHSLGNRRRVALVWIAAFSYLGLIALVTWQALRGQPLIAPDATTLAAAAAWLGATILAVGGVIAYGRGRTRGAF
jgi:hypothetical protein